MVGSLPLRVSPKSNCCSPRFRTFTFQFWLLEVVLVADCWLWTSDERASWLHPLGEVCVRVTKKQLAPNMRISPHSHLPFGTHGERKCARNQPHCICTDFCVHIRISTKKAVLDSAQYGEQKPSHVQETKVLVRKRNTMNYGVFIAQIRWYWISLVQFVICSVPLIWPDFFGRCNFETMF